MWYGATLLTTGILCVIAAELVDENYKWYCNNLKDVLTMIEEIIVL